MSPDQSLERLETEHAPVSQRLLSPRTTPAVLCAAASHRGFQASWTLYKVAIADNYKINMGSSLILPSHSKLISWNTLVLTLQYGDDWSLCVYLHSSSGNIQWIHCGEHKMHLRSIYSLRQWTSFTSSRLGKSYEKISPLKPSNVKKLLLSSQ